MKMEVSGAATTTCVTHTRQSSSAARRVRWAGWAGGIDGASIAAEGGIT